MTNVVCNNCVFEALLKHAEEFVHRQIRKMLKHILNNAQISTGWISHANIRTDKTNITSGVRNIETLDQLGRFWAKVRPVLTAVTPTSSPSNAR